MSCLGVRPTSTKGCDCRFSGRLERFVNVKFVMNEGNDVESLDVVPCVLCRVCWVIVVVRPQYSRTTDDGVVAVVEFWSEVGRSWAFRRR